MQKNDARYLHAWCTSSRLKNQARKNSICCICANQRPSDKSMKRPRTVRSRSVNLYRSLNAELLLIIYIFLHTLVPGILEINKPRPTKMPGQNNYNKNFAILEWWRTARSRVQWRFIRCMINGRGLYLFLLHHTCFGSSLIVHPINCHFSSGWWRYWNRPWWY